MTAFVIWFAHFMLCWAAVEIWPQGVRANWLAWAATGVALLAMGAHALRLQRSAESDESGELAAFNRRFAHGAIVIATVAVLFTALPSVVFLP